MRGDGDGVRLEADPVGLELGGAVGLVADWLDPGGAGTGRTTM